jgi:hypothetical protein
MSGDQEYQQYLSLRDQANAGWQHLDRLSALMAEQFMTDVPYGGDLDALRATFAGAVQKTRQAVAQYRAWLVKQQEGFQ